MSQPWPTWKKTRTQESSARKYGTGMDLYRVPPGLSPHPSPPYSDGIPSFPDFFPEIRSPKNLLTADSDGVSPMEVDWVSGASIIVRRKALEDVGPLDERFFMYWEDADWCRRMWQKGWKVVYFPRAEVVHYVGASSDKLATRSVLEFHKSTYRLFVKYNRPPLRFLNPIAFLGLAFRLGLVLSSRQVRSWFGKHADRVALRKNQADHQVK